MQPLDAGVPDSYKSRHPSAHTVVPCHASAVTHATGAESPATLFGCAEIRLINFGKASGEFELSLELRR